MDKAKGCVLEQVGVVKCVPLDIYMHWGLSVSFSVYTEAWEGPAWGLGVNMSVHTEGNWLQNQEGAPTPLFALLLDRQHSQTISFYSCDAERQRDVALL